ncbi:uncharacterized protein LOC110450122 isoform X2 [Mizuhopecten yessoensis]|uniref:uncharacterized protein LOC110450122 isoform X2 n=1 Tax=Mizuhopecten yessoensis TaxID=6573 RepID=UPI000B45B3F5|nr:uncharacterized protein LOC110450122 isoform X2 [Mizuhopecten yessoensis]
MYTFTWCSLTIAFLYSRNALIVISVLVLMDCLCVLGQMMVELHGMRIRFELEEDNIQLFENHLEKASANGTSLGIGSVSDIVLFLRNNMDVILNDRCSSYCDRQHLTSVLGDKSIANVDLQVLSDDPSPTNQPCRDGLTPTNQPCRDDLSPTNQPCIASNHLWIQFNEGTEELFVVGEIDLNFKRLVEHESHGNLADIYSVTSTINIVGIIIEAVMFVEVSVRTVCRGRYFYRRKFEVFDTIIVVVVFWVDIGFLCGNWSERSTDATTILILLLPWRFVRVIFSMITAITNKHQIQTQQLKTDKRLTDERLAHARSLVLQMEKDAESLTLLCKRKGATRTDIDSCYCKTTIAAVSTFASTMLLISAPALSESNFYHQGSRGHLFRKVFGVADDVFREENNNNIATPEEVVESDIPRTLRRAGPRVVNVTPPHSYQSLGELGPRVSVVEPCRRLLSVDESSTAEPSETGSLISEKSDQHEEATYL